MALTRRCQVLSVDLDNVSRGDVVVRVGEMSLSGGGDAVVFGVDEPMCCRDSLVSGDSSGVDDVVA